MTNLTELKRLFNHFRTQGVYRGSIAGFDKIYRWLTGGPVKRYSVIDEHIWIGGQPRRAGFSKLARYGITGVINMRSEYHYTLHKDLMNIHLLLLPTDDNEAPTIEHLHQGVDFIRGQVEQGGIVYIHCWEGLGRSATMAAAYYVSTGDTIEQAWAHIKRRRSFVRPTGVQIERLEEFSNNISNS
ncbi:MAG: dual specificity protein phosphatase family protein [Thermodesulfobacteriota bacterium]